MNLDDCYRLLDLDPRSTDEEIQRSHRDLMKVWHPDRFAHDPDLRQKAEDKLKAINQAHDAILAARTDGWRPSDDASRGYANVQRNDLRRGSWTWAVTCVVMGLLFLFRRPTPAGLVIALVLLTVAVVLIRRLFPPRG